MFHYISSYYLSVRPTLLLSKNIFKRYKHKQLDILLPRLIINQDFRRISLSCILWTSSSLPEDSQNRDVIKVSYITKEGEKIVVYGKEGDNVMHLAQKNSIDIEGACEASLACCTCHVYVRDDYFDKLNPPTEEEEDLLDMAPFLKSNSRLSI